MARALGRYELLRPLARGGMAEVFLARRRSGGVEKMLVIKRIRAERAADPRFLDLFVREARLSMSLSHQNIVPVFDFGRAGEQLFLAMERVEGADLAATLERGGPLPPLVAAFVAAECCQALAYAHGRATGDAGRGVIHRDVTPRNVMVSWSGEVKLTDFGVAALAGDDGGRAIGTPAYMAPEQARGEPPDVRADVYAVGMVLRELLTGQRARPGADRAELLDAARKGVLAPWPEAAAADIAALRVIAERATAPRADDRYPTAAALGAALDEQVVAMRAVSRGEAPALRLAAWMEEAWRGARDASDGDTAGLGTVELDGGSALGTGTERSLASTDAEADADADAEADADAGPAPPTPPAAPTPPVSRVETSAPPLATRRGRAGRGVVVAAAIAALGAVVVAALVVGLGGSGREPDPPVAARGTVDAAAAERAAVDARGLDPVDAAVAVVDRAPAVDAGLAVVDLARPPDGPRGRAPRPPRPPGVTAPPDGPAAPTPPLEVRRKVRVNARPWALVKVDDEPVEHETIATLLLTPGPHRLRFRNPELGVERAVTIVVPADRDLDHVEDLRR